MKMKLIFLLPVLLVSNVIQSSNPNNTQHVVRKRKLSVTFNQTADVKDDRDDDEVDVKDDRDVDKNVSQAKLRYCQLHEERYARQTIDLDNARRNNCILLSLGGILCIANLCCSTAHMVQDCSGNDLNLCTRSLSLFGKDLCFFGILTLGTGFNIV